MLNLFPGIDPEPHYKLNIFGLAMPLQAIAHVARRQKVVGIAFSAYCGGLNVIGCPFFSELTAADVTQASSLLEDDFPG